MPFRKARVGTSWYYGSRYSLRATRGTIKALGRDNPTQRPANGPVDVIHRCSGHLIE